MGSPLAYFIKTNNLDISSVLHSVLRSPALPVSHFLSLVGGSGTLMGGEHAQSGVQGSRDLGPGFGSTHLIEKH